MLYYYEIKRRRRHSVKRWFATLSILLIAWIYFSNPLAVTVPEVAKEVSRFVKLNSPLSKSEGQMEEVTLSEENFDLGTVKKVSYMLEEEGKKKEASELSYSLDLMAIVSEDHGPIAKTREKVIMQDIANTINYFKAGNTASDDMQILWNYDGGELAYVYYPNYGVHFNPVTTANMAIKQYERGDHKRVVNIADELLNNALEVEHPKLGRYYLWEYYFDLEFAKHTYPAPWVSGMAQSLVLDVFGKAFEITGDEKYLDAGTKVLSSFKIPWDEGGVTDSDEHGNWYLEIAATDKLKILNGFLFTLVSIHNYYEQSKDPEALALFDAGISELKAHLHEYDMGYWSKYSLLKDSRASYQYHKAHIDMLDKLYRITKDPEIKSYLDKFNFYLRNRFIDIPPTHRSFNEISFLAERGIISGKEGWFNCSDTIERGVFVSWLVRTLEWQPTNIYKGYYSDIRRDHDNWPYIEMAYDKGLRLADENGRFNPDERTSWSDLEIILSKALSASDENLTDLHVADLNQDIVSTAHPGNESAITREQAAHILYSILESKKAEQY